MHLSEKTSRKLINYATIISSIIIILLVIYWYRLGIFTDQEKMKAYLANKQIIGPIVFVLIQIVQVVIPIIPGGVSLLGGVIFFGPIQGFIYNYVGICIGSLINFSWHVIMVEVLSFILFQKILLTNIWSGRKIKRSSIGFLQFVF